MDFIIYNAKVAVLLAVFYMFYRLLLAKDTFHRVNRIVLLLAAVASFVLPLCVITTHRTVLLDYNPTAAETVMGGNGMTGETVATPLWHTVIVAVFWFGVLITLAHSAISIVRVCLLISGSKKYPQPDGTMIAVNDSIPSPFSWMKYIVMNSNDYAASEPAVLEHERGHISAHHSWDVILVNMITPLQWFNPSIWMLRTDLRAIHEFEADAAVLSRGVSTRQYMSLLIRKAVADGGYSIVNGFSHSTLKNRINMMMKKKSPRTGALKYLMLAPIVVTVLVLNAETVTEYTYRNASHGMERSAVATAEQTETARDNSHDKKKDDKSGSVSKVEKESNGTGTETPIKADDGSKEVIVVTNGGTSKPITVTVNPATTTDEAADSTQSGYITVKVKTNNDKVDMKNGTKKALLYIIDGTALSEDCDLNNVIQPNEIKSITVYKDKEHTAKYGKRGKDGVIVIERK